MSTEMNPQQIYEQKMILLDAQLAYEAYCKFTEWKSLATGQDLPKWENLPQGIKDAWCASAHAIMRRVHESRGW